MPRIKIDPSGTSSLASRLDSNLSQLNSIASQISSAASRLNWSVKSKSNIDSSIQNVLYKSNILSSELRSLSLYVMNATSRLVEADKNGARGINKKYGKYNKNIIGINQKLYENSKAGDTPKNKNNGDYYFEGEDGSGINRAYYLLWDSGPGHSATMLEKTDGSAIYYSWADVDKRSTFTRRDLSPEEFVEFKKDGVLQKHVEGETGNIPNSTYTKFISVPVSGQQGKNMFSEAQKLFIREGAYSEDNYKFSLWDNNCNQNVQKILAAGGLDFTLRGSPGGSNPLGAAAGFFVSAGQFLDPLDLTNSKGMGVVPTVSYDKGVNQWGQYDGYKSGKFETKSSGGGGGGKGW